MYVKTVNFILKDTSWIQPFLNCRSIEEFKSEILEELKTGLTPTMQEIANKYLLI